MGSEERGRSRLIGYFRLSKNSCTKPNITNASSAAVSTAIINTCRLNLSASGVCTLRKLVSHRTHMISRIMASTTGQAGLMIIPVAGIKIRKGINMYLIFRAPAIALSRSLCLRLNSCASCAFTATLQNRQVLASTEINSLQDGHRNTPAIVVAICPPGD